jgi:tetratricopeptide (TPR) repeat protein
MRQITFSLVYVLVVLSGLLAGLLITPPLCVAAAVRELPADIERLYNGGLYRQAEEALHAAIQREPQESYLHYWLGRCFYELRDYNRAISSLERAVALDPNRSDYHDWLGKSYGRKAEETNLFSAFSSISLAHKARREFEGAVRLDANNLEAQRDLIRYLLNAPGIVGGSEGAAQQRINALAAVDSIEAALAQAELFVSRKKFNEADREYRKVLDLKPNRIGVYFEIAEYYRDRGDAERMSQAIEAGVPLAPSDHRLDYYRGISLILGNQDQAAAERDLRHYLDTVPDNANVPSHSTVHEWLGRLYERKGQLDRAAQEYQAALILDPRNKLAAEALKALQRR